MQKFEIPLSSQNQQFMFDLGGTTYFLRFLFNQTQDDRSCWLLDISDVDKNPIVTGLQLVTGVDLLGQFKYLNFNVILYCWSDGANPYATPTFDNLGSGSHVYYEVLNS